MHRHTRHTSDDFRFPRVDEAANLPFGIRIGKGQQHSLANLAPAADEFIAKLYEIDGTLKLVPPLCLCRFFLALVDLHDRSRPQQRIHREVGSADHAVRSVFQIQMLQCTNGDRSPDGSEPRQKVRLVQLQVLARTERHNNRFGNAFVGFADQLCFRRREPRLVPPEVAQIQSEVGKDVRPVRPVDRSKAIKTNVGDSIEVLVHVERRPGRRFISEVLELKRYDPDSDLFEYSVVYEKEKQE